MKYQSVVKSEGELMNAWKERLIEYIKTLDDAVPLEEVKKLKSHWLFHVSFDNMIRVSKGTPIRTLKISYKITNLCQEMV